MPRHTNLVRRGAIYYYRARVPSDLRQHYQRSEFLVSLKTSDRHHAECVLVDLRHQLAIDFQRLRGKERQHFDRLVIKPAVTEQTECNERTVWDLVDYWSKQAERRPRTQMEVNTTFERFVACNGNLAPGAIQKQHIVKLKDWLLEKGLAAATVRKAINLVSAVFELAVANDLLPFNPARGIRLAKPKVERKSRVPFDASDLKRLFASPVFSQGARPLGGRGEAAYWLPYLGLWTGARLEELGQLLVQDVQQEQGNHYLAIQDDPATDKRLKSVSSRRRIPLHPELIRLGFLDYVRQQADLGHARLFPLLTRTGGRQLTSSWSHWFCRYLRNEVGISDRRKVFHSFRHGFKEACRVSGIPKEIHDQLTGHASRDVGDGYGGERFPLSPLVVAIERLRYE